MPDLLAHALLAYAIARVASLRYDWLTRPYVTAVMAGAFIPDIMKARLLVSSGEMSALLGMPFSWGGWMTLGGAVVFVLVGGLLVAPAVRQKAAIALAVGAASHLLSDALLINASGRSYPVFWPLTRWVPPTPGWYLSTEPRPTVVAALLALAAYGLWRYQGERAGPSEG